ncbi:Jag family protein [Brachybacterium sp. AOP25-B2-12]|uniref:Jag family protein n=1 Tax=Brachybacterium sp. AOP25-B2-12 TaxID=3457710 RepID=UPI00403462A7
MNDTTAPEETGAPGSEDTTPQAVAATAETAETVEIADGIEAAPSDEEAAPPADPAEGADTDEEPRPQVSAEERLKALEEEGDIAADYLEELLDIADLDGDIDIDVDGDRASVEIRGAEGLNRLNEPKGELMDALQELARLAVQTRTGNRSRLMLDVGGFRAKNRTELQQLAESAIEQARTEGGPVPLRPMNPFERKVVHDVAKAAGLRSESDGDGKDRHVVIYPAS